MDSVILEVAGTKRLLVEKPPLLLAVPASDALELLEIECLGVWPLSTTPPNGLLSILSDRVRTESAFGPALMANPAAVRRLFDRLVQDGVRQHFLDGQPLQWQDLGKFHDWARAQVLDLSSSQIRVFASLNHLYDRYMHSRIDEIVSDHDLDEDIQAQNLLVSPQVHRFNDATKLIYWTQLTWGQHSFARRFEALRTTIGIRIKSAIEQGRLIVVENTPQGDRVIDAGTAAEMVAKTPANRSVSFLPTISIPTSWLQNELNDQATHKALGVEQAKRIFEALYAWGMEHGKRVPRGDAEIIAVEYAKISMESAKQAWRQADIPEWKERGNLPQSEKILINDIRGLISSGEIAWDSHDYLD